MTKFKKGDKIKIKYLNGTNLQFADYAVGDVLTVDEDSFCPWCIDKNGTRQLINEAQAELVTKDETMKKTIDNKEYLISEGEGGVLTFTPVVKERVPENHKPKAGDVWRTPGDVNYLIGKVNSMEISSGHHYRFEGTACGASEFYDPGDTYLGTFDEVYVKISDVVAALSIKDDDGDSIYSSIMEGDARIPFAECIEKTRDALVKLNIK